MSDDDWLDAYDAWESTRDRMRNEFVAQARAEFRRAGFVAVESYGDEVRFTSALTKSARPGVRFQVTDFEGDEPIGHHEFADLDEALLELWNVASPRTKGLPPVPNPRRSSRLYYRIQPSGRGIRHRSETSTGRKTRGLHVFERPSETFHTDGPREYYGDEVIVIEAAGHRDTGDVEGVEIDPSSAKIVARYPWSKWEKLWMNALSVDDARDLSYVDDELFDPALLVPNPASDYTTEVMHIDTSGRGSYEQHKYLIQATATNGTIVGYMNVRLYQNVADVSYVEVDPEYRRRGVAEAMYRKLYQWADEENVFVKHSGMTPEGAATVSALRERGVIPKRRKVAANPGERPAFKYRYLGTNEDESVCGCCGRQDLKRVAWLVALDEDGNEIGRPVAYGTTCAGNLLRGIYQKGAKKPTKSQSERLLEENRNESLREAWAKALAQPLPPMPEISLGQNKYGVHVVRIGDEDFNRSTVFDREGRLIPAPYPERDIDKAKKDWERNRRLEFALEIAKQMGLQDVGRYDLVRANSQQLNPREGHLRSRIARI